MTSRDDDLNETAAQLRAIAHPLRLRILRLCLHQERTNQELANLLNVPPATTHRHVQELLAVGFLTAGQMRTGHRGAWERPYRATGASWHLPMHHIEDPVPSRHLQATITAHLAELQAHDTITTSSEARGTTRLTPDALRQLLDELESLLRRYGDRDDPGGTPVSFLWSLYSTQDQ